MQIIAPTRIMARITETDMRAVSRNMFFPLPRLLQSKDKRPNGEVDVDAVKLDVAPPAEESDRAGISSTDTKSN